MNDDSTNRKNLFDEAAKEIHRLLGEGIEIVDAKVDLKIPMLEVDHKGAVPGDPRRCVFARSCKRIFGSRYVFFWRTVAYVEMLDGRGVRRIYRYMMSEDMRDLVAKFDVGEGVIPEGGFTLRAPSEYRSLGSETKRRGERARIEARRAEAIAGLGVERQPLLGTTEMQTTSNRQPGTSQVGRMTAEVSSTREPDEPIGRGQGKFRDGPLVIKNGVRSGSGKVHLNCKPRK